MRAPEQLQTERLDLRPVRLGDAPQMFAAYASHAAPTRFMNFPRHADVAETRAFAASCEGWWSKGSAFPWAVIERSTGALAGVMELRLAPPKADFGYILGEAFWGRGLATEAANAVVAWAMAQPQIHRVWATCHPDNHASAAVLRKAGLTFEAALPCWEARPQLGETAGESHLYTRLKPAP